MAKYYFTKDSEACKTVEAHLEDMKDEGISELVVYEAKPEFGSPYFFCHEHGEIGDKNGTCGKQCPQYLPRNGRSGRCKHSGHVYEATGNKRTLRLAITHDTI